MYRLSFILADINTASRVSFRRADSEISTGAFIYFLISEIDDAHFLGDLVAFAPLFYEFLGEMLPIFSIFVGVTRMCIELTIFGLLQPYFPCCGAAIDATAFDLPCTC
jgi:hypothetical protein